MFIQAIPAKTGSGNSRLCSRLVILIRENDIPMVQLQASASVIKWISPCDFMCLSENNTLCFADMCISKSAFHKPLSRVNRFFIPLNRHSAR